MVHKQGMARAIAAKIPGYNVGVQVGVQVGSNNIKAHQGAGPGCAVGIEMCSPEHVPNVCEQRLLGSVLAKTSCSSFISTLRPFLPQGLFGCFILLLTSFSPEKLSLTS